MLLRIEGYRTNTMLAGQMMTELYFIGGASGSGKSAILSELQKLLGEKIKVYDFDDMGVPVGADTKWRQKSTEKWLQKLLEDDQDACLLGQIVLGEILACPSATKIDKVNFCLLDVGDFERIQRLKKRNTYGADQNMLHWSSWLRMHHQNPQWAQHVVKEDAWEGLNFCHWDQLEHWTNKAHIKTLDTTRLSVKDAASEVASFILEPKKTNSVVFLNGPSSSGKTTLVKKLQNNLDQPYLHIGIDKIIEMMPEKLNNWHGGKVDQGFFWDLTEDTSGNKLAYLKLGPFAFKMSCFFKNIVVLALETGHSVIVDEVCVIEGSFDAWRKLLSPYNALYVALKASTTTLEQREKKRGDRMPGSARTQNAIVHADKKYDLELNTDVLSLDECLDRVRMKMRKTGLA
jgi:chloramphenicol 3-O-phosphotransferase